MHAKSDSEVTSLAPSSPTRSPRRPLYYVQSPSRDSHDGEKSSLQSTPVLSPMGSPPHSQSSLGRHSRESSTSRFSGSFKPGSRKISPNDHGRHGAGKSNKAWKQCAVIEEEGLLQDENRQKPLPCLCYFLIVVLSAVFLLSLLSLSFWGASRTNKPKITMKSIVFENFIIQAGADYSGVATEMMSMNSTVKLSFRNPANLFGLHVTSTVLDLSYDQLNVATGHMKKFYQSRKSQRNINVVVQGDKIPLYGGGASLNILGTTAGSATATTTKTAVPLKLRFVVRSRAHVFGKLVKRKFYTQIECSVVLDPTKLNTPVSLKNSCQYD